MSKVDLSLREGAIRATQERARLRAEQALAEVQSIPEGKRFVALAEAAKRISSNEEERELAAEYALKGKRATGELLADLERRQGLRTDRLPAGAAAGSPYQAALVEADIAERTDHVLHNGHHPDGDRVMFLEYKGGGKLLTDGQRILKAALEGQWEDAEGRRLFIRYAVLPQRIDDPRWLLEPIIEWVWPRTEARL